MQIMVATIHLAIPALVVCIALPCSGFAETVRLANGNILKQASAQKFTPQGVTVAHEDGLGTFSWSEIAEEDKEKLGYSRFLSQKQSDELRAEQEAKQAERDREQASANARAFIENEKHKREQGGALYISDLEKILQKAFTELGKDPLSVASELLGPPSQKLGPKSSSERCIITGRIIPQVDTDYVFFEAVDDPVLQKKQAVTLKKRVGGNRDGELLEAYYLSEFTGSYSSLVARKKL